MTPGIEWYWWQAKDLYLLIRAIPRAKQTRFCEIRSGALQVRLNAPPVDGKANKELVGYLSRQFGIGRSSVELLKGEKGREKKVVIRNPQQLPEELGLSWP